MEAKKTKIGLLVGGFVLALAGLALSMFFEQIIFYQFEQVTCFFFLNVEAVVSLNLLDHLEGESENETNIKNARSI